MSMKHTPGPWHLGSVDRNGEDAHMCEVQTKYATKSRGADIACYDLICRTWSPKYLAASIRLDRNTCIANARLIAAAPELLAALERCMDRLGIVIESDQENGWPACEANDVAYAAARAAIAKATESSAP